MLSHEIRNIEIFLSKDPPVITEIIFVKPDAPPSPYFKTVNVVPNVGYTIKVEVLLNDLGEDHEKVSNIEFGGMKIGECNPNCGHDCRDNACVFYDCAKHLHENSVSFVTDRISVKLEYVGHSKDCDCHERTWECKPEDEDSDLTPTLALARITLTPQGRFFLSLTFTFR